MKAPRAYLNSRPLLAMCLGLASVLGGCAGNPPCSTDQCRSDLAITDHLDALIREHPALEAPNVVRVQTSGGVVYLYGQVNSEVERSEAETLAHAVPGVRQVVDSINFGYEGR